MLPFSCYNCNLSLSLLCRRGLKVSWLFFCQSCSDKTLERLQIYGRLSLFQQKLDIYILPFIISHWNTLGYILFCVECSWKKVFPANILYQSNWRIVKYMIPTTLNLNNFNNDNKIMEKVQDELCHMDGLQPIATLN